MALEGLSCPPPPQPLLHGSGDFELLFTCFNCARFGVLMLLFPWQQNKSTVCVDVRIFHVSVGLSHPADK